MNSDTISASAAPPAAPTPPKHKPSTEVLRMADAVYNKLMSRADLVGMMTGGLRPDVDAICGHPPVVTIQDCHYAYTRGDVAARCISILPEESFSQDPDVYETEDIEDTEFEQAWDELNLKLSLVSQMERIDKLSGIGRYGIMLLGFDDGGDLNTPVTKATQLLYVRTFDETVLQIKALNNNTRDPRYGLPESYAVNFMDNTNALLTPMLASPPIMTGGTNWMDVHWSRVIHVADNRTNSEVFGLPRLEKVFNRLLDMRKVAGGSGEMFWKGGFPGLSIESHPQLGEEVDFDKEATKEQMEAYALGLQRYIATIGMTVRSLAVQVADPGPHLEVQLKLIATALGVPWRIFIGSESAHLAASQDDRTWNRRLTQRRMNYLNPFLIRPFIDRLIQFGVLPTPKSNYTIYWPDLNTPSDADRAQNAEAMGNAIAKYVQTGADSLLTPFYFLTWVLGMEEREANAALKAAREGQDSDLIPEPIPARGARAGIPNPALNGNAR